MISLTLRASILSIALAATVLSQSKAAKIYLDAYTEWRKLDPTLERDAGTAGAQAADRVTRVYSAASKYGVARSAYVRSLADESGQLLLWIQNSATGGEIDLVPVKLEQALVSTATEAATRGIATYAKDTDRGIVQLRQALERERVVLTELNQAITDRDNAWAKARQLLESTEEIRARAMAQYQTLSTGYSSAAAEAEREEPSWAAYYQSLADELLRPPAPASPAVTSAAAGGIGPPSSPASDGGNAEGPTPVLIAGVRIMNPANPDLARTQPAPAEPARALPSSAPPPAIVPLAGTATASAPVVSLNRYIGGWTYPVTGGMFFGVQPESIDMQVREDNGRITGTLAARFKTPAGTDPDIRLSFSGELSATRNQSFAAETVDGAKGTIELIPGSAYNLLEVNFRTEPRAGKLNLVNFVVIKK